MRRRARIANRRPGGLWWRAPAAIALWLPGAAAITAALVALSILHDYAADLPAVPDLAGWQRAAPSTSRLVAADGTLVAALPFDDRGVVGHRDLITYEELPPLAIAALLAAEDARFVSHRGVDLRAVARAAVANLRAGRVVEGASTITQQVARNLLPEAIGDERSLRRKVREALLARRIERHHRKERILEAYANLVFLGAGAYGLAAGARLYFDQPLDALSAAQHALLAGQIQAPSRTDPTVSPGAARARRDEVLRRMHRAGALDDDALASALDEPLVLSPPPRPYGHIAPWHTERARREVERAWPAAYRRGGLVIETTAQPLLSRDALARARRHAERLAPGDADAPEVGAVLLDHVTGYVEATVGGLDWWRSRFDRATQACRQPGSAFKPIVYAAALEAGAITPGTLLRDGPISVWDDRLGVHWKPDNSGRAFRGAALAQDALAASLNAPAIDVLDRVGVDAVIAMARRLGVDSELARVRPLALGASCVVPLELARAFAVFASGGDGRAPIFVRRVRRGERVLVDRASPYDPSLAPARRLDRLVSRAAEQVTTEPALDPRIAFQVSDMLRDVVRRGTGTAARQLGREAAGKTGTTNDNTDAWFAGYTGRLIAVVWLGHDDPARRLGPRQDGGRAALPLWMQLVARAEEGRRRRPVPGAPPAGMTEVRVDRDSGLRAVAGGARLHFLDGTEPSESAARGQVPGAADFARAAEGF